MPPNGAGLSLAAREFHASPSDFGSSQPTSSGPRPTVMRAVGDYGQYEGFARVNLKDRYFPTVEFGYGSADKTDDVTGLRYKPAAPFGRIGMDFNVMKNKHDVYRILVGVRYAYTSFNYDIGPLDVKDPVWGGNATFEAKDQKCSYGWQ